MTDTKIAVVLAVVLIGFGSIFRVQGEAVYLPMLQASPQFPVPRAESEFKLLIRYLRREAEPLRGNAEEFKRLVQPFGPLDLQVEKATPEEAETLRNFYFGVAGAVARIDQRTTMQLTDRFHCGAPCTESRKRHVVEHLDDFSDAFAVLWKLPSTVKVIAQWGTQDEYRINSMFRRQAGTWRYIPTPIMGFVPSSQGEIADGEEQMAELGISPTVLHELLSTMRKAQIAAVVRDPNGIRVVYTGMADNEAGLLFLGEKGRMPERGQKTPDGREYRYVEIVDADVIYYETT